MSQDISDILNSWEYDPEKTIRIIVARDGRQVLQIRLPMGIEQYELDGRPDGMRPFGKETVLEEYQERLKVHMEKTGSEEGFAIDREAFIMLQTEGILYYYRYLHLYQIGDYARTIRDTKHNLDMCDLVDRFYPDTEDKNELLQYKPYIIRMNALSQAMLSFNLHEKLSAQDILETAIREIEALENIDTPTFRFEKTRSLDSLNQVLNQLRGKKFTHLDKLREELETAVQEENYEKAAVLRDRIRGLEEDEAD